MESSKLFQPYLIHREEKRDKKTDLLFIEVHFQPLSPPIPASSGEDALEKAKGKYPLYPHRLAIGDHHGN